MRGDANHNLLEQLERDSLQAMMGEDGVPYNLFRPTHWRAPVIFASPHSGAVYPESFLARAACDLQTLRMNEDAYIDQLFSGVSQMGAPLLSARFPRCFVDVNRSPDELPPEWVSGDATPVQPTARAKAGFGVIPLMMAQDTPIYRESLPKSAALMRIERLYAPYHSALTELIKDCVSRFGRAVVIDCHSMPGFAALGARRADIVLGDRFGLSCHLRTIQAVETAFVNTGYNVVRNSPYAGGFVTTHYGRSAKDPQRVVETLQIEINRDLYLNPVTLNPKTRHYDTLAENLNDIIWQIIQSVGEGLASDRYAAE